MVKQPIAQAQSVLWLESILAFFLRFKRFTWDVVGVILLAAASLTLLALIGLTSGAWLSPWALLLRRALGWGSVFVVAALGVSGVLLVRQRQDDFSKKDWWRVVALELGAFSVVALLAIIGGLSLDRAEEGLDGGLIGWGTATFIGILLSSLPVWLSAAIRFLILAGFTVLGFISGLGLFSRAIFKLDWLLDNDFIQETDILSSQSGISVGEMSQAKGENKVNKTSRARRSSIPQEYRKQFKVEDAKSPSISTAARDESLPSLDLLVQDKGVKPDERHINQTAGLIEKTLGEFGIPAKVVGFKIGPTVTEFAVEPGYLEKQGVKSEDARHKVRVSQISGLQRDLAMALSASRLRIQAPVPGRSYVGIEVPNREMTLVRLRPILETEVFNKLKSPLALALGRDVSGQPVVADLARMPHLLIAGTTGSGKSVSIAALTISLVMNNSPENLRIVMIDPKRVELIRFNGMPHLYGTVETNLERIGGVLRWVVAEMQNRYKLLEALRARDIHSYNKKVRRRKDGETIPNIVVIIDELADLMMSAADQTETTLVRLAQMARATGIHLIVATQRPSTDVVTGLIKANFPARISFAVASSVDSRVILDGPGAETLLGKGDMLYLAPETGIPMRCQGIMVTDQEIENVINYWRNNWKNEEENEHTENEKEPPWEHMLLHESKMTGSDEMLDKAISLIRESGRASASMIQRRLRIGYPRAARLMDELEDIGVVGPTRGGGKEREILIDLDSNDEDY